MYVLEREGACIVLSLSIKVFSFRRWPVEVLAVIGSFFEVMVDLVL